MAIRIKQAHKYEKMSDTKKTIKTKLSNSHYQPPKAELEKEYDMPKLSKEQARRAFFKPKTVGRKFD